VKLERKESQEVPSKATYTTPRLVSFGKVGLITAGGTQGTGLDLTKKS
jgi:hypothetical protein